MLQSVPFHGKNILFVLILDYKQYNKKAIATEKAKAKKLKRDQNRREFHQLHRRYLDPEQGEWDVDPSSALAS